MSANMRTVVTPTTAQLIVATASGAKPTYENSGNGSRWIAMRSVNRDPQRSPRGPGRGEVKKPEGSPHDLIAGLWNGHQRVTLRTKDVQRVFLHYGGDYLHMKNGVGHHLKSKRVGPGVYDVWLEARR